MSEFTKGKVSDVPAGVNRLRSGRGLTQAIRELKEGEALFVPANGRSIADASSNLSTLAGHALGRGICRTRRDHEKDGVWIFLRQNGGSA